MKRIAIIFFCLIVAGCGVFQPTNPSPAVYNTLANDKQRLVMVGALSEGVDVSLKKDDVPAAIELNNHIASIAEKATPQEVALVIGSLANKEKEQELEKKLSALITEKRKLENNQLIMIDSLSNKNKELQQKQKETQEELDNFKDNPMSSIVYGVKTLIKRFVWGIVGFGIVFMLLRILASSNPIAASIFSMVEKVVAWLIDCFTAFFPKMIAYTKTFRRREETTDIIIDAIQELPKTATIADLKQKLNEDLDSTHKQEIDSIKRRLGW
jgi:hypothetical protein